MRHLFVLQVRKLASWCSFAMYHALFFLEVVKTSTPPNPDAVAVAVPEFSSPLSCLSYQCPVCSHCQLGWSHRCGCVMSRLCKTREPTQCTPRIYSSVFTFSIYCLSSFGVPSLRHFFFFWIIHLQDYQSTEAPDLSYEQARCASGHTIKWIRRQRDMWQSCKFGAFRGIESANFLKSFYLSHLGWGLTASGAPLTFGTVSNEPSVLQRWFCHLTQRTIIVPPFCLKLSTCCFRSL